MLVLNLDLDLFASPIVFRGSDLERPPDEGASVLTEQEIRLFLEDQCGLDPKNPAPGAVVRSHVDVMPIWDQLISAGHLSAPFDLCHADAHDDLGVDTEDDAFVYLCNELLLLPVEKRPFLTEGRCKAGNYLSYAIAYRWLASIVFVRHPEWDQPLPQQFLAGDGEAIKLGPLCVLDEASARYPRPPVGCEVDEPAIAIKSRAMSDFKSTADFEFVFVSESPGFVPPKGDWMVDIVREYVGPLPSG